MAALRTFAAGRAAQRAACALAGVALAGCAGLPSRQPPAPLKPAASYATQLSFAGAAQAWPPASWWTRYGDPQLDALVGEAVGGAPSVAAARARLQRAQAQAGVAGAALAPQVSASSSVTEQLQSNDYLSPRAATPQGWNDYGRTTLDFSWELDLWGRNRAALAAATSEALAARADTELARLALAASVASAYAELQRQYAALDTARAALQVRDKTVELFEQRRGNGLETLGSVRQVQSRRAAAAADVLAGEEQIALQKNRIAALLGAGPDRGLAIGRPAVDLSRPFGLPADLAAGLIGRRPDVIAARLRAEAAAHRIDQARAAFYPDVNLMAFVGLQSINLDRLARGDSAIGSIGPALSLPLFEGGRLRGQLDGAAADYAEAVAGYERAVVQALQDVADAVTSRRALAGRIQKVDDAVDAAREAWRIQNNRYQGGLSTYLDVLSAEDTLLAELQAQSDLRSRSFALDVALAQALGGGYDGNPQ